MGQGPAKKSLRESMPVTAAWIDALRFEFGRADVDAWVRAGLKDGSFRAEEAGQVLGGVVQQDGGGNGGHGG